MQQRLDQSLASLNISLRDHNLRYIQFGKQTLYLERLGTQDLKSITKSLGDRVAHTEHELGSY